MSVDTDPGRELSALMAEHGGFGTIVIDPPWPSGSNPGKRSKWIGTNMRPRYGTMKARDIAALPIDVIAADDAILVVWATWMHLDLAIRCIEGWGFEYATGVPWLKVTKGWATKGGLIDPIYGPGVWFQHCTELVLIARRGRPFGKLGNPRPARKGIIISPRGEHSAKPSELQDWIDSKPFPGPKLEMFARQRRTGWVGWGSEYPT